MKTTKRIRWILSVVACGLLLASPITALETNGLASGQNPPEVAAVVSNAPAVSVTNEAAMNLEDRGGGQPQPIVMFGQNVELKAGESAEAVVVIGGSAKIHGKVREAVVTIGGSSEVDGEVGEAVVAVMGNVHLKPGAKINKNAVAVMGTLTVDPGVKIGGDAVSVGGRLNVAEGATVHGGKVNVGLPIPFVNTDWLGKWLRYCVFELRPLAPQVGFVWIIAGMFFLFYLFVATVFPRPVQACVDSLTQRPATTFLMGLLTKILVPVVLLILAITGIGLIVVPFLWAALFLCAVVGKVAVLEWLGLKLGRHIGKGFEKPLVAFLIGTLLLTLLYMVPFLGLLTYAIFGIWGLGCAVTATFSRTRREMPEKPAAPPPTYEPPPTMAVMGAVPMTGTPPIRSGATQGGTSEAPMASAVPPQGAPPVQTTPTATPATPPVLGELSSFPKAGFWERMGAAFLDMVVVGFIAGIAHGPLGFLLAFLSGPPIFFIVALAYFAGMWAWKGTTVGGIVLKLYVVRADGQPLTFVAALVRGLATAFSVVVLFLGFLWIAWDRDKQGWHDKIAGTVVVRLPRSIPLVCL
jgi:uncharacterized RDD family membrane protein YckC